MPKKIRINQSDYYRPILTDALPYEVPLRFSFFQLYKHLNEEVRQGAAYNSNRKMILKGLINSKYEYIPYTITVKQGFGKTRELHVVHPHAIKLLCDLYYKYGDVIVSLCSRSKWSVRRPISIAKMYRARKHYSGSVPSSLPATPGTPEQYSENPRYASTYFAYAPYSHMYKYYNSLDYANMEQRFNKYCSLDIASCFGSIYTHTISWAVRTKHNAKQNRNVPNTFDNMFDSYMQSINHKETNGIVVGPESSRVFAEIILQAIDVSVEKQCLGLGLVDGKDFTIRRYLDDYLIFYNSDNTLDLVVGVLTKSLQEYRLHFNVAKTEYFKRPFITNITATKHEIKSLVDEYMPFNGNELTGQEFINKFKCVLSKYGTDYEDCVSYALVLIRTKLR